ncbi:MAG: ketoacyl-ACP synthase III [Planctomycetes bacterium]|nr:ketoacyl-ACP synthase III [Planctomycetota bacterium]MBI3832895.1 ketoacyl-ACP synthase III [Planctomycetota bacterium]
MNHGLIEAEIRAIAAALPKGVVTNDDLDREHPEWNLELIARRLGVVRRHIARSDETALDLGDQACRSLFESHPNLRQDVDTLIFCTQSADYILPPNATVLHGRLELPQRVAAFDINLACSGFVYALHIARSMIRCGAAQHILLVAGDTYSKYINKSDRSARVLFGDGAAATWIAPSANGLRIGAAMCETSGRDFETFIIPAGGCRRARSNETLIEHTDESGNVRCSENIHMAGRGLLDFMSSTIPRHVEEFLRRNELRKDDIDLYVFHQASGVVLESLQCALGLEPDRVYRNLRDIGNTVSASIPIALRDAQSDHRMSRGGRVLLCGFGVGLSWGSVLLDVL